MAKGVIIPTTTPNFHDVAPIRSPSTSSHVLTITINITITPHHSLPVCAEELVRREQFITKIKHDNYYWCFPVEKDQEYNIHDVIAFVHEKVGMTYFASREGVITLGSE